MKKFMLISFLFVTIAGAWGCKTVVTQRPAEPTVTIVRPPQPNPNYVWVDGEWYSRGGKYYRNEGRWVMPKKGHNWVPGHWEKNKRGSYYVSGHWK